MIKTYKQALDIIFKKEETTKYNLDNIKKWLELLWNPQNNFKIIHIAWTNGKGSTSKMIFSILKQAKEKVWVFTSPHLVDIRERFETENWKISEEEFLVILNKILDLNIDLSYFDKCVLIALEFFKLKKCEYVILEVGLWWRLDTTNVVNPIITVITSIWLDHQNILWDNIEKISKEKAGIIKKNIPLVLNFKNNVIEKIAKEKNAKIIYTNKKIKTNLLWKFQEKNAWIAYEIAKFLKIEEKNIFSWLQKVDHIWRLQFLEKNMLVDWAHNEDSLKELKKYVEKNLKNKFEKIFYCFSLKKGKNIDLIINNIWKENNFILVDIKKEILENMTKYKEKYEIKNKQEIFNLQKENPKNLYIIFWSLYMIGDFIEKYKKNIKKI